MLQISDELEKSLPSSVKNSLGQMPEEQQAVFEEEYKKKFKKPVVGLILAFFGLSLIYRGKIGLFLLFILSAGALGIWYFIELFIVMGKLKSQNEDNAKSILRDMKIMSS